VREPFVGSTRLRLAGLALHAYTASGTVLALLIVIAAIDGDAVRALWLGLAALVIDGTDGMLARRLRVKETIPWFDGAMLDNIVDYLTYAFAPIVLLWTGGYLPNGFIGAALAALPLLASSYQFCRTDAKTDDHFFLGFPSYWNLLRGGARARPDGDRRDPAGLLDPGVRAGEVRLPVPDQGVPLDEPADHRDLARVVRRTAGADAEPERDRGRDLAGLPGVLRGAESLSHLLGAAA
jgi:hypothetical protein